MPGKKKQRYSAKERRQVEHIRENEEARGVSEQEATGIAYATVNKLNPDAKRYSSKERRQAKHIMESEEKSGKSKRVAKRIAYATVNKRTS